MLVWGSVFVSTSVKLQRILLLHGLCVVYVLQNLHFCMAGLL